MFMKKDFSLSAVTAGFLAVLISYAGPLVIFFPSRPKCPRLRRNDVVLGLGHFHRRRAVGHLAERLAQGAGQLGAAWPMP